MKKNCVMRNTITILLVVYFIILCPQNLCHADSQYDLVDPGFSITIPDDLITITRSTPQSSSCWGKIGLDAKTFLVFMQENYMYLDAMSQDLKTEILVTMISGTAEEKIFDYNLYSDKELDAFHNQLIENTSSMGMQLDKGTYRSISPVKWYDYQVHQVQNDQDIYSEVYTTVINGKRINITYHSYGTPLKNSDKEVLENCVSSVVFRSIETPSGNTLADSIQAQKETSFSDVRYKAIIAGISAAILSGVYCIFKALTKKPVDIKDYIPSGPVEWRSETGKQKTDDLASSDDFVKTEHAITSPEKPLHSSPIAPATDSPASYCKECGTRLKPNAKFCSECGAEVLINEQPFPDEKTANNMLTEQTVEPATISLYDKGLSPSLRRAFLFAEDEEWSRADEYLEKELDMEPENAYAYLGKLLVELKVRSVDELSKKADEVKSSRNYKRALRFSDEELRLFLESVFEQ